MEEDVFTLSIKYKGAHKLAEVRAVFPAGSDALKADFSITINWKSFVIHRGLLQSNEPAWILIGGQADKEVVRLVGQAIERHFE